MLELVFLGTAASAPSIQRGLPAQMVLYRDERFLVDCGEGTQRQILRSGLGFRRLNRVLLTHGHLDHILGLGGLISTFSRWEAVEDLEIYGARRTLDRVNDLVFGVVLRGARPPVGIDLVDVKPGVLLESPTPRSRCPRSRTVVPVVWAIVFSRRPGARSAPLGVPPGPVRRDLVNGQTVTLADGRTVAPTTCWDPTGPGSRLP